jgi:hypothetical protein
MQLGLHPPYRAAGVRRVGPRDAGIPRRVFGHHNPFSRLTHCRPSPCAGLSPARSTTTAPSRLLPSADDAPIPPVTARPTAPRGTHSRRFPRSLTSDRRVRRPALPLRHRHGYAVDLHRDLPGPHHATCLEVPADRHRPAVCTATQPTSTGFELVTSQEASNTGSSRTPSRLAHRARPIRQSRTVPTSSRLLAALPGVPRVRLPPASPGRYDGPAGKVSHPLSDNQRLVAHHDGCRTVAAGDDNRGICIRHPWRSARRAARATHSRGGRRTRGSRSRR